MKRPEILLVNPWIHDFAAYDLWARPIGLLILANRLRLLGWEPRFIDCLDPNHPGLPPRKLKPHSHGKFHRTPITKPKQLQHVPRTYCRYGVDPELIKKDLENLPTPKAILVTSIMTYWYTGVRETISLLREIFGRIPILLGGVYASILPNHALSLGADQVLIGPGEKVLPEALHSWSGIVSRSIEAVPALEFSPALDLMRRVDFLPLLTSRGCPFRCSYCASNKINPFFVRRPPSEVVNEIEQASNSYGISDIALYDDAFLVDAPHHALPILETVSAKISNVRWHCPNGLHASLISRQVSFAMKKAGFETIRIGLESSSNEFHARTGRKTDAKSFLSAVRNLQDAGFSRKQIGVYLLVGLPGQSKSSVEDDIDLVLSAGAFPKLAEYSPIPGTQMWEKAVKTSRYPINQEPLFHNCTLLPAAEPEIDAEFLKITRKRIKDFVYGPLSEVDSQN